MSRTGGLSSSDRRNGPLIGGIVLVVIGAALLIAQFVPDLARYVVLAIGLGLLALFAATRAYGALVGGSITTGVGVGVALTSIFTGELAAAAVLLSIGGGFLFIWLVTYMMRMPEHHFWPLIPGAIMATIGGALAIGGIAVNVLSYWPVVLIGLGIVLIVVAYSRRR